jgi:hypothetical protein
MGVITGSDCARRADVTEFACASGATPANGCVEIVSLTATAAVAAGSMPVMVTPALASFGNVTLALVAVAKVAVAFPLCGVVVTVPQAAITADATAIKTQRSSVQVCTRKQRPFKHPHGKQQPGRIVLDGCVGMTSASCAAR